MTDWAANFGNRQRWLDWLAWAGSGGAVMLALLATAALALQLQAAEGIRAARDVVILLDLQPPPAALAITAFADPAPDVPFTDAPEGLVAPQTPVDTAPHRLPDADPTTRLATDAPQITPPPPQPDAVAFDTAVPLPLAPLPPKPPKSAAIEKPDVTPAPTPKPAPKAAAKPKAFSAPAPSKAADAPKAAAQPATVGKSTAAVPKGRVKNLVARWGASIRAKVQKRNGYPKAAKGAQGSVTLRLTVRRDGSVQSVSIASSSGNAVLDAAALAAVARAGQFSAAPKDLTEASYGFSLALDYQR